MKISLREKLRLVEEKAEARQAMYDALHKKFVSTVDDLDRFKREYASTKHELEMVLRDKEREPTKLVLLEAAQERMIAEVDAAHKTTKELSERSIRIIDHLMKKLHHYEHMKSQNNDLFDLIGEAASLLRASRREPAVREWREKYMVLQDAEVSLHWENQDGEKKGKKT